MTSLKFEITSIPGRKSYRPGDVVSGFIHLDLSYKAAQAAKRIEVAFCGRSEIDCTHSADHSPWQGNSRTVFFDELQVVCVYDPTHLPVIGHTQWPFNFVFPAVASANQRLRKWDHLTTVASEPDFPLPPSYPSRKRHADKINWSSKSASTKTWSYAAQGRASIIYDLEARLLTVQGTYLSLCNQLLSFIPYIRLPVTQPSYEQSVHPIQCESRRLLPNFDQTSFRSRAKGFMLKNPVSAFKLIVGIPKFSVGGKPFPLYLGIQYDTEHSTTKELPPVYLQSVKISCVQRVFLGHHQPAQGADKGPKLRWQRQLIMLQYQFQKGSEVQITERIDLRDVIPVQSLMVHHVEFQTLNIEHKFLNLSVAMVVTCAGSEYPVSAQLGDQNSTYSIIPPTAPPKEFELASTDRLPSKVQSKAIYETKANVAAGETEGETNYEMGARIVPGEVVGKSVRATDSIADPSELPDDPVHE